MKKSEYERRRREHHGGIGVFGPIEVYTMLIRRDIEAAEAAGVVWEPEEEPLAERVLIGRYSQLGDAWILWRDRDRRLALTEAEAGCAADLYNRRKDIATVGRNLREAGGSAEITHLRADALRMWADLLEGTEKACQRK